MTTDKTATIFYFAGRPVAQRNVVVAGPTDTLYLTTDHLGTPILATSGAGAELWEGGFRPFGGTFTFLEGTELFLRFPGQWDDPSWKTSGRTAGLYQNVHRWYQTGIGRYERPDPLGAGGGNNPYRYVRANPVNFFDRLALVESPADCGCCSDQETTRQFTQIVNYIRANSERYRITRHVFGSGCGGAADQMQSDVENDLKPSCWVTKSQLTRRVNTLNRISLALAGVNVDVHRVLGLSPCSPNQVFSGDLYVNPYFGPIGVGPLKPPYRGPIEDLSDPICP